MQQEYQVLGQRIPEEEDGEDDEQESSDSDSSDDDSDDSEDSNVLKKIGELPAVRQGLDNVWERYALSKESNVLFSSSLELAEFSVHLLTALAGPAFYRRFQTHVDKANEKACAYMEHLEEQYPRLSGQPDEVAELCKEKCQDTWVYVEPFFRPVTNIPGAWIVSAASKLAYRITKGMFKVWYTCAWYLWLKPTIFCLNFGIAVSSAVLNIGFKVADGVVQAVLKTQEDEQLMPQAEKELDVRSSQVTLEMIEELLYLVLSDFHDDRHQRRRSRRVPLTKLGQALARNIHETKEGDVVMSMKLLMCVLLGWTLNIVTVGIMLVKLGSSLPAKSYRLLVTTIDRIWNWCVYLLPDGLPHPPTDPVAKVEALLRHLIQAVGKLLVHCLKQSAVIPHSLCQGCLYFLRFFKNEGNASDTCTSGCLKRCSVKLADYAMYIVDVIKNQMAHVLQHDVESPDSD